MFDTLSDRLERIAGRLRSRGRLNDADLDEALREIRTALLEADVELGVVRSFTESVRARCSDEVLSKSLTPGQQVVKAVHEELVEVLGGEPLKITYASKPPTVVLLAGLQGSGKTTTSAKLALWWKQQGRHPLLVAADLQRPAAVEQLKVLGEQAGVTVFSQAGDPVSVAAAGVEEARRIGRDLCVIDTAGRLAIDAELMDEVRRISQVTSPHYTFLVVDAMTGQDAVATATAFHETLALDGVIVTKLDGDARGGAALSVKGVVGRPIVFASTGEKLGDFDLFHPDRMADRILGMGDVLTLIEQAERTMDRDVVERSAGRMMEGRFTLEDFLEQLQQVKKLGSLGGIMKLLPGMSKDLRQAADQIDDREIGRVEAMIRSMTAEERLNPTVIDGSRRTRIARGSGTTTQDVNQLLKQFREMQKMMKGLGAGGALPGMPAMGGGRLGGLLGGRRSLPDLSSLGGAGSDGDLAALMGEIGGSSGGLEALGVGVGAGRPTAGGAKTSRSGGKKKKKGGRVTPPKRR
ncbi:MAG TPA: signal recognition particle protein [Acidimicrobiales bacterium]|nr:signal recognition particle protein [Acidimicrobiales bacterium]